jgi:hypothetical protein
MSPFDVVRPAYGRGSLAEVMPAALAALGVPGTRDVLDLPLGGVRRLAVLLVDGLGSRLLPSASRVAPVLADALAGRLGSLRTITCGFPSTTPTSLTSLGTGAAPGGHGVIGFTVNVPGTDRVLNHTEWLDDPDPLAWQPLPTQFAQASAAGVSVRMVSRGRFAGSGLTVSAWRGARHRPADNPDALAATMLRALTDTDPPVLVYGYHPELDTAGHDHGVASPEWTAAATVVDRLIVRLVDGLPADAALLVTADHGQLDIPADRRFDVDNDATLREGVRVVAGEARVRYLHTVPGAAADVVATWRGVLGDAAWVAEREEAVAGGWFGPVDERHLPRIGDVVAACRDDYAIMATAREPERVTRMVAFHGSWTATEMLVPLLVIRSSPD